MAEGLTPAQTSAAKQMLEAREAMAVRAFEKLAKELASANPVVVRFIEAHRTEMPAESLEALNLVGVTDAAFLKALALRSVAVHERKSSFEFVFDFGLDANYSDELLCVRFAGDGTIESRVTHES